jgi:glyoxylase-like metal-dependent hydrolase (beta-lactamase superfamily II)
LTAPTIVSAVTGMTRSISDATTVAASRWHSAPRARSVRLGRLRVTYVADGIIEARPSLLWPSSDMSYWEARPEHLDPAGFLVMGAGGLLVEGDGWTILIDSGLGPTTVAPTVSGLGTVQGGALISSLARLGKRTEDLSTVAITHLHLDHVGWWCTEADQSGATSPLSGIRAVMTAEEWEDDGHRASSHSSSDTVDELTPAQQFADILDALKPTMELVGDGDEIAPGVSVHRMPGHTHGHAAYRITSGGATLLAFGDAFHSPVQIAHPDWVDATDHDPRGALDTRLNLLASLSEPDTFGFGIHFSDVVFGRVARDEHTYRWQPIETELTLDLDTGCSRPLMK